MLYKLSETKFNAIKQYYGNAIANKVNEALRASENCRDVGYVSYEVTVRTNCGDHASCLDKAIFLFGKGNEIIEIKQPKMRAWYNSNDVDIAYLEEKTVVFITKAGEPCFGNIDAVDTEDASIHLEDDNWYWMKDIQQIMVLV